MEKMYLIKCTLASVFMWLFWSCDIETVTKKSSPIGFQPSPTSQTSKQRLISGYHIIYLIRDGKLSCFSEMDYPERSFSEMKNIKFKSFEIFWPTTIDPHKLNAACGLTEDDQIACFHFTKEEHQKLKTLDPRGRKFIAIYGTNDIVCGQQESKELFCFEPRPNKKYDRANPPGPYKDIAVLFDSICGINLSNEIDCTIIDGLPNSVEGNLIPDVNKSHINFRTHKFKNLNITSRIRVDDYCALDQEGKARCFKVRTYANLTPPNPSMKWREISAPSLHLHGTYACGLDLSSTLWCFEIQNQDLIPFDKAREEKFISIMSGPFVTCGIKQDHTKACWKNPYPNFRGCKLSERDFMQ